MVRKYQEIFHKIAPTSVRKFVKSFVPKNMKDAVRYSLASLGDWEKREDQCPETLKFETTNICNADCVFCGYQYQDRPKGVMSMELYERVLREYVAWGGKKIAFTPVVGDPLVDTKIVERIRLAVELGIDDIYFHTNGILLSRHDTVDALLTSGLKALHVSTAGFDRDMFERVYRSKKYDDLLEGVKKLLARNKELGEPVTIHIEFRPDQPIDDVLSTPDFKEFVEPFVPRERISWLTEYDNWGGMITQDQLTGNMRLATPSQLKKRPCSRTFTAMLMHDGQIRACSCRFNAGGFDDLVVGNTHDKSLKEIWLDQDVRDLRRSFVTGQLKDVCQACSWYEPA